MTTERKHRCGGVLTPNEVQIVDDTQDGMIAVWMIPGLVCGSCHEEFVEGGRILEIEKGRQTPTVVWVYPPSVVPTSELKEPIFTTLASNPGLVLAA